jgi:hypothetical protein
MSTDEMPQFLGESEHHVEVGNRKEIFPSLVEPPVRIRSMTFGTASVSAGMIGIAKVSAVIALAKVSAQGLCPAVGDVLKCTPMARKDPIAEALQILGPVTPKDIRQFGHCPEATRGRLLDR